MHAENRTKVKPWTCLVRYTAAIALSFVANSWDTYCLLFDSKIPVTQVSCMWLIMLHVSLVGALAQLSILSATALSDLHYNVPLTSLSSVGCSECQDSSSTASKDLAPCSGPYLLFGLKSSAAYVFDIAVCKETTGVNLHTRFDSPFECDGTFWHYNGGNQGMSSVTTLTRSCDTSGIGEAAISNRGGRDGHLDDGKETSTKVVLSIDINNDYRKFTFTCPTGIFNHT
jgi:hypothetical protein